jgi:hypothetical protein
MSVHIQPNIDNFQGAISNILEENVVQPLLVSTSAIRLASETVAMILKIDDIVSVNCGILVTRFSGCSQIEKSLSSLLSMECMRLEEPSCFCLLSICKQGELQSASCKWDGCNIFVHFLLHFQLVLVDWRAFV